MGRNSEPDSACEQPARICNYRFDCRVKAVRNRIIGKRLKIATFLFVAIKASVEILQFETLLSSICVWVVISVPLFPQGIEVNRTGFFGLPLRFLSSSVFRKSLHTRRLGKGS